MVVLGHVMPLPVVETLFNVNYSASISLDEVAISTLPTAEPLIVTLTNLVIRLKLYGIGNASDEYAALDEVVEDATAVIDGGNMMTRSWTKHGENWPAVLLIGTTATSALAV